MAPFHHCATDSFLMGRPWEWWVYDLPCVELVALPLHRGVASDIVEGWAVAGPLPCLVLHAGWCTGGWVLPLPWEVLVITLDSHPLPLWGWRLASGCSAQSQQGGQSEPLAAAAAAADVQGRLWYRPGWDVPMPHATTSGSIVVGHKLLASLAFAWWL